MVAGVCWRTFCCLLAAITATLLDHADASGSGSLRGSHPRSRTLQEAEVANAGWCVFMRSSEAPCSRVDAPLLLRMRGGGNAASNLPSGSTSAGSYKAGKMLLDAAARGEVRSHCLASLRGMPLSRALSLPCVHKSPNLPLPPS